MIGKRQTLNVIFRVYQALRALRYGVLTTVFGVTIHCKHTPTCGTYWFRKMESDGILKGSVKGLKRVLTCW